MTPLNYEDLNLESENNSELLRDSLIEKVYLYLIYLS